VVAGPVADQNDVVVRVDDAGDDGASLRLITLTLPLLSTCLPTSAKRPFLIRTSLTTRFDPSMVWILPLVRTSPSDLCAFLAALASSSRSANVGVGNASALTPIRAAAKIPRPIRKLAVLMALPFRSI